MGTRHVPPWALASSPQWRSLLTPVGTRSSPPNCPLSSCRWLSSLCVPCTCSPRTPANRHRTSAAFDRCAAALLRQKGSWRLDPCGARAAYRQTAILRRRHELRKNECGIDSSVNHRQPLKNAGRGVCRLSKNFSFVTPLGSSDRL